MNCEIRKKNIIVTVKPRVISSVVCPKASKKK